MDILIIVSENLKQFREKAQLSIADLERKSGVGKATISSLEAARGNPTVETLWALADALNIPFGMLVSRSSVHANSVIRSGEGVTVTGNSGYTRLIEEISSQGPLEIYEMVLSPHQKRVANPHPKGVTEHILVVQGWLQTGTENEFTVLGKGDFISFRGDLPHTYAATDEETRVIVWMEYPHRLHETKGSENAELGYTDNIAASMEPEYWAQVQRHIEQSWIEIMNGLTMKRLRFLVEPWNVQSLIRRLEKCREDLQQNAEYCWGIRSFIVREENHISFISFQKHQTQCIFPIDVHQKLSTGKDQWDRKSTIEKLKSLHKYVRDASSRTLTDPEIEFFQNCASDSSLVVRTLVSEILTQNGYPTNPTRHSCSKFHGG